MTFSKSPNAKLIQILKQFNIPMWNITEAHKDSSHAERAQLMFKQHYERLAGAPVTVSELGVSNKICATCSTDVVPALSPENSDVMSRGWGGLGRLMGGLESVGAVLGTIPLLVQAGEVANCNAGCRLDPYTGNVYREGTVEYNWRYVS